MIIQYNNNSINKLYTMNPRTTTDRTDNKRGARESKDASEHERNRSEGKRFRVEYLKIFC